MLILCFFMTKCKCLCRVERSSALLKVALYRMCTVLNLYYFLSVVTVMIVTDRKLISRDVPAVVSGCSESIAPK